MFLRETFVKNFRIFYFAKKRKCFHFSRANKMLLNCIRQKKFFEKCKIFHAIRLSLFAGNPRCEDEFSNKQANMQSTIIWPNSPLKIIVITIINLQVSYDTSLSSVPNMSEYKQMNAKISYLQKSKIVFFKPWGCQ